jgi:hypothetical protein
MIVALDRVRGMVQPRAERLQAFLLQYRVARAWSRWVRMLDHREPGTPLALFRIATGLCALHMVTSVVRNDLVRVLWLDKPYGGFHTMPTKLPWLISALGGARPDVIWAVIAGCLVASSCLILGVGGRVAALATLFTLGNLTAVQDNASGSYDELIENALWLLFLAPNDATLSLSCRLRTGKWWSTEPVVAWPRYLVIVQIVIVYWTTGLQKVSSYWTPGGDFSALYYIFQQPTWQRFDMEWVAYFFPFTQLSTFVTWTWEVCAPLWLLAFWFRGTRARPGKLRAYFNAWDVRFWYAAVGWIFHAGLILFMDVGPFSLVSLCYYLAFWHHDEYASWWRRYSTTR